MPVYDARRSFPPVQGHFTLKQSSEVFYHPDVLPQSSWVYPGEKPIRLTEQGRKDLSNAVGEKGMALIESCIGTAPRQRPPPPDVEPIFRFETAWGKAVTRPTYRLGTHVKRTPEGCSFLDNPNTKNHKFFWPTMTNEYIDGKARKQPMEDPGRIPMGTMTTFVPSTRLFGKDKSKSSSMATKVDGYAWHQQYTSVMRSAYGSRFKEPVPDRKAPGAR